MAKKRVATKGDIQIHLRLKQTDAVALDADRKALPGVPVGRVAYARHAVLSYPKLRKLEELLRRDANHNENEDPEKRYAYDILAEAGL